MNKWQHAMTFTHTQQHYNITFQEKMKGKNKLVPRLLGITKESVVRVDAKTKEVRIPPTTNNYI